MAIPAARKRILDLAADLENGRVAPSDAAKELREIERSMYRRRFGRAPRRSLPVNRTLTNLIRHYHRAHPDWSHQKIANLVGVNPGRVSEILHGSV